MLHCGTCIRADAQPPSSLFVKENRVNFQRVEIYLLKKTLKYRPMLLLYIIDNQDGMNASNFQIESSRGKKRIVKKKVLWSGLWICLSNDNFVELCCQRLICIYIGLLIILLICFPYCVKTCWLIYVIYSILFTESYNSLVWFYPICQRTILCLETLHLMSKFRFVLFHDLLWFISENIELFLLCNMLYIWIDLQNCSFVTFDMNDSHFVESFWNSVINRNGTVLLSKCQRKKFVSSRVIVSSVTTCHTIILHLHTTEILPM